MQVEKSVVTRFMETAAELIVAIKKGEIDRGYAESCMVFAVMGAMTRGSLVAHWDLIARTVGDLEGMMSGRAIHAATPDFGVLSARVQAGTGTICQGNVDKLDAIADKLRIALKNSNKGGQQ